MTEFFRVYKRHTGKWEVESLDIYKNPKGYKSFELKREAKNFARDIAKKNRGVLIIENARGQKIDEVDYS